VYYVNIRNCRIEAVANRTLGWNMPTKVNFRDRFERAGGASSASCTRPFPLDARASSGWAHFLAGLGGSE
jgi:hypothetical protein